MLTAAYLLFVSSRQGTKLRPTFKSSAMCDPVEPGRRDDTESCLRPSKSGDRGCWRDGHLLAFDS